MSWNRLQPRASPDEWGREIESIDTPVCCAILFHVLCKLALSVPLAAGLGLMMTNADSVLSQSLQTLAQQCAQETQQFFQHRAENTHSCLELFQRAIITRQEEAWEAIYKQYEPQVTRWVQRHPSFVHTGESADYFVNLAFIRIWKALTPEKFAQFGDIKDVMRYLQICIHSAIVDYLRVRSATTVGLEDVGVGRKLSDKRKGLDILTLDRIQQAELRRIIQSRLQNDKERFVFDCCYSWDMKPREIYQEWPDMFRDVKEIYRIKENILTRLRRDREIQAYLSENAGNFRS